jgi:hypothetical protein
VVPSRRFHAGRADYWLARCPPRFGRRVSLALHLLSTQASTSPSTVLGLFLLPHPFQRRRRFLKFQIRRAANGCARPPSIPQPPSPRRRGPHFAVIRRRDCTVMENTQPKPPLPPRPKPPIPPGPNPPLPLSHDLHGSCSNYDGRVPFAPWVFFLPPNCPNIRPLGLIFLTSIK